MFKRKFTLNSLLILGIILIAQYFFAFSLLNNVDDQNQRKLYDYTYREYLYLQTFLIIVAGPIFEELSFRLFIGSRKKWISLISILLLFYYLLKSFTFLLAIFLGISILSTIILGYKFKGNWILITQIVISSLIFSLSHFNGDFIINSQYFLFTLILYFIGLGFVFSWLKINFNIVASMGLHIFINSIGLVSSLFFGETQDKTIICGQKEIVYNSRVFLKTDSLSTTQYKQDTLLIKKSNIVYMLDAFYTDQDTLDEKYYQTNQLLHYNMRIPDFKNTPPKKLFDCLEKENIVKKDLKFDLKN